MTGVETYSCIDWAGIIWDREAISENFLTGEATGVHLTGAVGQSVLITALYGTSILYVQC